MRARVQFELTCVAAALTAVLVPRAAVAHDLPNGSAKVAAIPMEGPFPDLPAACHELGLEGEDCLVGAAAAERCGAAAANKPSLPAPFLEASVLVPGSGVCALGLRTGQGWFVSSVQGLPLWAAFLHNGERYVSEVREVRASADGKSVLFRGDFIHSTTPEKMPWLRRAALPEWLECEERLFVCAVGAAGPSCAGPFPVAYTTYCRDVDDEHKRLTRSVPQDFRYRVELSGTTLRLLGKHARSAPLPGWAVLAIDASRLANVKRSLSPPQVKLEFP